jgi:hypothetical protein
MKINFIIICICLNYIPVFAYSSAASKFAEQEYAKKNNCEKVKINMKKEYSTEYQQDTGKIIIYGWGDIKIKGCKKKKITYVVLLDNFGKPGWSSINFYK